MDEQKSAIVTGAGSGIGRATALLLGEAGYALTLVGRTRSKLDETAALLRQAHVCAGDIADPAVCSRIVRQTIDRFGRLDALANVAGDAPNQPLDQVTPDICRRCMDTNVNAIVYLTVAAWPHLKRQHSGVIVNVSSIASLDPFPGFSVYAAAKAAVNMYTRITATEGGEHGIRAVVVAPGAVETPMLRAIFDEKMIPGDKTLSPRDVAAVIRDCITGARPFEPGGVITVPSP